MTLSTSFTHCFVIPGQSSIIDAINPETGRSCICGETLDEIRARYPEAVVVMYDDWRTEQAQKQDTPIRWERTTADQYQDMLEVLPPAFWASGLFLVGEPTDHSFATGRPRFSAYWERRGRYYVANRPITIAEARAMLAGRFAAAV